MIMIVMMSPECSAPPAPRGSGPGHRWGSHTGQQRGGGLQQRCESFMISIIFWANIWIDTEWRHPLWYVTIWACLNSPGVCSAHGSVGFSLLCAGNTFVWHKQGLILCMTHLPWLFIWWPALTLVTRWEAALCHESHCVGLITHTVLHSAQRVTRKFATPFVTHEKQKMCILVEKIYYS